jgi:hypothetical protein
MTPNVQSLTLAYQTLWTPSRAFETLRGRQSWAALFALLFVLNAVSSMFMLPYAQRAATLQIEAQPSAQSGNSLPPRKVNQEVLVGQQVGMLLGPILLLIKWSAIAGVLWAILILVGKDVAFRQMLAMVVYASLPLALASYVGYGLIMARGLDAIGGLHDLKPLLGVNAFIHAGSGAVDAILASLNPFDAWYVCLLAIGLHHVGTLERRRAATLAASYWGVTVALQVTLAVMAQSVLKP